MAVLGLRFCARAFSSCGKRGPLFIAMRGPLTIAASLVAEHRLQTRRLSSCGSRAQLLRGMGSYQTRARTRVPCIGRQIPNHCATREAPITLFIATVSALNPWLSGNEQSVEFGLLSEQGLETECLFCRVFSVKKPILPRVL